MIVEQVINLLLEDDPPLKDVAGDAFNFRFEQYGNENLWTVHRKMSDGWQDIGYIALNPRTLRYTPWSLHLPGEERGHRVDGLSKPTKLGAAQSLWRIYNILISESAADPDPRDIIPYRSLRGFVFVPAISEPDNPYKFVPLATSVYSVDRNRDFSTCVGVIRKSIGTGVFGWLPIAVRDPSVGGSEGRYISLHYGYLPSRQAAAEAVLREFEKLQNK